MGIEKSYGGRCSFGCDPRGESSEPQQIRFAGFFVFILSLSKQALNGHYENKNPSPLGEGFAVALRRKRDSNPRIRGNRSTVFKTAAFDRSAISPPQR
jgi:hypothetical protein